MNEEQNEYSPLDEELKFHVKIDWRRQDSIFLGYAIVLLGFYGLIANTVMFDIYNHWIPYSEMEREILIWPYLVYFKNYDDYRDILRLLSVLLLFLTSFLLTYKEDIPHYGIKASIWLVPCIIAEGFTFYFLMFGFSAEPFVLQFLHLEGYINILILYGNVIAGAVSGMYLKKFIKEKKQVED